MWWLQFASLICLFSSHFGLSSGADFSFYDDYKGKFLGSFIGGSRGITGNVYVLNATTLLVEGFQYSGEGGVFFMVGTSLQPSSQGADIAEVNDFNAPQDLGKYDRDGNGKYVILRLPRDFSNYRWLSVFCMTCQMSFAQVYKPDDFVVPSPINIAGLSGTTVFSTSATIINNRMIQLNGLAYDGSCPDAYYWVGEGVINADGYKALDETLRANKLDSSFSNQDVTIILPKSKSIEDINYIGVWCQSWGTSLGSTVIPSLSPNTLPAYVEKGYIGKYLGTFQLRGSVSNNAHGVRGAVYAINERTLYIKDFSYDGQAPATYVWGSVTPTPSTDGERFLTNSSLIPLEESENEFLISHIPPGKTINDYSSISIWCQQAAADFGSFVIPTGFEAPKPKDLGQLGLPTRPHNVYVRNVKIIDKHTFVFEDMSYDGMTSSGFFYAGVGNTPDRRGKPLFWKMKDRDDIVGRTFETIQPLPQRPLPNNMAFDGTMDVYVILPKELTVFEIGYIGIWDTAGMNLGHIEIPEADDLCIPAYHDVDMDAHYNCEVIKEDTFNVHWLMNEETEELEVTLVGRVQPGQYLAFGLSGSNTGSSMIGGDVAVAWIDPIFQHGIAKDYYLTSKEPCINSGTGSQGACPDEATNGQNNIMMRYATYYDGVATIAYSRKLDTGDSRDIVVPTDREVYIIWGIGPVDSEGRVLKHLMRSEGNHAINFGRDGSRCPVITGGAPPEERPWSPLHIVADTPTTFKATIGPAGLKRGYEGITGRPGWGIAWHINGLLIPEITVRRGVTYTFEIYGGNNPAMTASYHPFYISADDIGGYDTSTPLEQQSMQIFAGPAEGPLCEWKSSVRVSPDDFDSFLAYKDATLYEDCMPGSPGVMTWTPDANTPNTVYYNCYSHRYLGWKINVQDFIIPCTPNQFACSVYTDTRCMDVSKRCDGNPDCPEADDELNCGGPCDDEPCQNGGICLESDGNAYFCFCTGDYTGDHCEIPGMQDCHPENEFKCEVVSTRPCIGIGEICDGYQDCADGADERDCVCHDDQYKCVADGSCISTSYICDGETDCDDGSDESVELHNCVQRECTEDEFTCGNGLCIPDRWLCNDYNDCGDNSDEGQLCIGVCGTSPKNISVNTNAPTALSFQAPVNFPSTIIDSCEWYISAPPGVRVYARILSYSVKAPGALFIRPINDYGPEYVIYEEPAASMILDLISPVGGNTLYLQLVDVLAPFTDDAFVISFSTWTGGAIQTCSNGIQVLNSNQICDRFRNCFDGSDEIEMCPCPPGVFRNESCGQEQLLCHDTSFCPAYGRSKICDISNCGACSTVVFDKTGRRLTDAECNSPNCASGLFTCVQPRETYFKCISTELQCDGIAQCADAADENGCPRRPCTENEFTCGNGLCIPNILTCNHVSECGDNSDEHSDCDYSCDPFAEFTCANDRCTRKVYLCDGDNDCGDNSDELEENCMVMECLDNQFACPNNNDCIPDSWRCDHFDDCGDNSDEIGCCQDGEFECGNENCVPSSAACNGANDCGDQSDELGCGTCEEYEFLCSASGQCIPAYSVCDEYDDCGDNSDEQGCERSCSAVGPAIPCRVNPCDDIFNQCVSFGPEKKCILNECGTCSAEFYQFDGRKIDDEECDRHGCQPGFFQCEHPAPEFFECLPPDYVCDGASDCYDAADEQGCDRTPCSLTEFTCGNDLCVDLSSVCDMVNDCGDLSDESDCADPRCSDGFGRPLNGITVTTDDPCAVCRCSNGRRICDETVTCPQPPYYYELCDRVPRNGQCCLEYDCSRVCFDDAGRFRLPGETIPSDNPCLICSCNNNEVNCAIIDCPPIPSTPGCMPEYKDDQCCPSFDHCKKCADGEFECGNGNCVPSSAVCNGANNCGDQSDELGCGTCEEYEFLCSASGQCIPAYSVCDEYDDCGDNSDEQGCERSCPVDAPPVSCADNTCDVFNQCVSFGPEKKCILNDCGTCSAEFFHFDGRKIDDVECDRHGCQPGFFQCEHPAPEFFECLPPDYVCDGASDCYDAADEQGCDRTPCSLTEFTCGNGLCVDLSSVCDMVNDCGDLSDESDCADPRCTNAFGQPLNGLPVTTDDPCAVCRCSNGRRICDETVTCPQPPHYYELCDRVPRDGQCCLEYDCSRVCLDDAGRPRLPGETIPSNDPCLICSCDNNQVICAIVDCPPIPPTPELCVPEYKDDQCCPSYDHCKMSPSLNVAGELTLDVPFTPSLLNPSSPEFRQLASDVEQSLYSWYRNFHDSLERVEVTSLRQGSVISSFNLHYYQPPGDIASVGNMVTALLQSLVNTGNVGSYPVVPGPVPMVTVEATCLEGSFLCGNQLCISHDLVCDGTDNCGDRSDEQNCGDGCPIDGCFTEYNPVCGSDGLTYPNSCELDKAACFNKDLKQVYPWVCAACPVMFCTEQYDPQCGSDGVTYSNPCYLSQAVCNNNMLTFAHEGECGFGCPIDACTTEYNPQCGSDGQTYPNPCELARARCSNNMLTLAHEGECGPVIDPCTSQPCQNGDVCRPSGTGFECCHTGFGGSLICQPTPDVCASSPCLNGGACFDARIVDGSGYQCQCLQGYTGPRCEHSGPDMCPPGVPIVNCFVNPCDVNSCPSYPFATCVPNFCGGCNATFYDSNRNEITNCFGCPMNVCTEEYDPQCGTDGVTYSNPCYFEQAKCANRMLTLAYPGRCDIDCRNPMYEGYHIPNEDPCTNCTCRNGERICLAVLCAGPQHELCVPISGPNVCCPEFDCSRVCVNEFGQPQPYLQGEILPSSNPCQRCSCFGTEIQCAIIDCPPPPPGAERCIPIYPPDQCCPLYDNCVKLPSVSVTSSLVLDLPFTSGLLNPSSVEYTQLAASLEQELFSYFQRYHSSLERVDVNNFRQGSVIPSFSLFYTNPPVENTGGTGTIEEQVSVSLIPVFESLLNSRRLGSYTLKPQTLPPITVQANCDVGAFMCGNQNCVNINQLCDGINNCGDASDEQNCVDTCPEGVPTIATCPTGCNPSVCPSAVTCRQENCGSCRTLYFDGFGNPLAMCSACPIDACTFEWDPQCGSDGMSYSNPCALMAAACMNPFLTLAHEGECRDRPFCYDDFGNPIADGQDFLTDDPCEFCTCSDGERRCAVIGCAPPIYHGLCEAFHRPGECCPEYDCSRACLDDFGRPRPPGETIPSRDPCQICSCNAEMEINCALFDCPMPPFPILPGPMPGPGIPPLPGVPPLPIPSMCPPIYVEDQCCPSYDHCSDQCPPDAPRVNCFQDPCEVTSCPAFPNARCESNYCGGCNAIFYDHNDNPIPKCSGCPILFCSREYIPQCGSDGVTYPNPCELAKAICSNNGLTLAHPGECTGRCPIDFCTEQYDPQCGSDGMTYSNPCYFEQAKCTRNGLYVAYPGSCFGCPVQICTTEYLPQCGTDGVTYGNLCELGGAVCYKDGLALAHPGECRGVNPCDSNPCRLGTTCRPTDRDPTAYECCYEGPLGICLPNPVDPCSSSPCLNAGTCFPVGDGFRCLCQPGYSGPYCQTQVMVNACDRRPCQNGGTCTQMGDLFICTCTAGYTGRLCEMRIQECPRVCTLEYDPVCGSDGMTYSNLCHLERAAECLYPDLELQYPGECTLGGCPPGVPTVRCFEDPCVLNRCPNYPNAKCVSHYCGGCYALFYDDNGSPISECNSCPITTCPLDYKPECGSNGVTYPNPCALSAAACLEVNLELASHGECQRGCPNDRCTSEYEPVCGTNGVSYTNRCWLNVATCRDKSIQFRYEGVCIPPPPGCPVDFCTKEYIPHCGTDGKTYSNACHLNKQRCEDPELELMHIGECDCEEECPEIYDPVCGSNSRTFSNRCVFETQLRCFDPSLRIVHEGICRAALPPWPQSQVGFGPNNRFTVEIGDSGGMRGYIGMTGNPSPGVSWYIDGKLIPVVTVVRGRDYIFYVSGGRDHGFYITNDEMGGYLVQTPEELRGVKIYAGPAYGPLCEWTAMSDPDSYNTFEDFSRRGLTKTCESHNPAVLVWKPDRDTPDVLYYQSYNEKYVGWKIRVVDHLPPGGSANRLAYSTMLLAVSLITCTLLMWLIR